MPPSPKLVAGALIARKYRLLRPIGAGGMAAVWIARNETTRADVALKFLLDEERESTAERFRNEAQLSALVTHSNIVQIFDLIDEPDGSLALVMELLRGEPLDQLVRERGGRLEAREAIAAIVPILSGLSHAHKLGVVHRDVKPGNIFLAVDSDGCVVPKLLDFGVAKVPASSTALTLDGRALGTPRYMSPEQIRGGADLDGRSDLFAVGVTLFELLTGSSPFEAPTASATLAAVLERQVDPDPQIAPALWVELARSLAKRPYGRHASAAQMAEALRAALGATDAELDQALQAIAPPAEPPSPVIQATPTGLAAESNSVPSRRSSRWGWAAAGALVVIATVGTLAIAQRGGVTATPRAAAITSASAVGSVAASFAAEAPAASASSPATAPSATASPPREAKPPRPRAAPTAAPTAPRVHGEDPPRSSSTPRPVATSPGF